MRRFAFLCVCVTCLSGSCGPSKPSRTNEPSEVSVEELARAFRNNQKDRIYTGAVVQCRLAAKSYRVRRGMIEALWFQDHLPGCVYFYCYSAPSDSSRPLIVTGRCSGIVRDGIQREATTDFYVRVDDCSVSSLEP